MNEDRANVKNDPSEQIRSATLGALSRSNSPVHVSELTPASNHRSDLGFSTFCVF